MLTFTSAQVEKTLSKFKKMVAYCRFTQFHLNYPQDFWNNVLQTDETKVEMFGHNAQNHVHMTARS